MPTGTPVSVGTKTDPAQNATTVNLVTTAAVPAAANTLLCLAHWFVSPATRPTATVSGAGLTGWNRLGFLQGTDGDPYDLELWGVDASAGVAISATISSAFSSQKYGIVMAAFYLTSADVASPVDGAPVGTFRATPTTAWATGSFTPTQPDDTIIAIAGSDGNTISSAPSGTVANELVEPIDATLQWNLPVDYLVGHGAGAVNGQGTWSASAPAFADAALLVAIKAAGGGAASPDAVPFRSDYPPNKLGPF